MGKKILIIDDDEEYVAALTCMLEARDYGVVTAHNGRTGVSLARTEQPDLILLDNMMETELEGIETARALQADEELRHIPVVMITGMRQKLNLPFEVKPDEAWLPVKAVLSKPVSREVLLKTLKRFLSRGS